MTEMASGCAQWLSLSGDGVQLCASRYSMYSPSTKEPQPFFPLYRVLRRYRYLILTTKTEQYTVELTVPFSLFQCLFPSCQAVKVGTDSGPAGQVKPLAGHRPPKVDVRHQASPPTGQTPCRPRKASEEAHSHQADPCLGLQMKASEVLASSGREGWEENYFIVLCCAVLESSILP